MSLIIGIICALTGIGVYLACEDLIKQTRKEMTMCKVNNQIMNICNLVERYNNGDMSLKDTIYFYPFDQSLRGLWYDPRDEETLRDDYEYVIYLPDSLELRGIISETGCKNVNVNVYGDYHDIEKKEEKLLKDFVNVIFECREEVKQ